MKKNRKKLAGVGVTIREYRQKAGLSQDALADRMDLSTPYISMLESGKRYPSIEMLIRIALALNVKPGAILDSILFRKPESKVEVINDINKDVVTLYRVVQHHLEEFIRYFKWVLVARDEFDRLKKAPPETLTDIQRSARFYYLQHAGFNGRVVNPNFRYSTSTRPKINLLRIEESLSEAHLRLCRVYIECLPYAEVIARYDRSVCLTPK